VKATVGFTEGIETSWSDSCHADKIMITADTASARRGGCDNSCWTVRTVCSWRAPCKGDVFPAGERPTRYRSRRKQLERHLSLRL